ncbi:hypothetical protein BCW_0283 [Bacillus cereus W]|nr:hypothetical protein BCW_0283 [Bacillus cereus W]
MFLHGYKTNMLHKEHVHRKHLQTVVEFLQGEHRYWGAVYLCL